MCEIAAGIEKAKGLMDTIARSYAAILGDGLTGIYVHGSLAFGCFCWQTSDIDFIVVTDAPPQQWQKQEMIAQLLRLDAAAPAKGFEMSVVRRQDCLHFVYPTPFSLHYSNTHKAGYEKDLPGYCAQMQGVDKDLAAHFTVIRHVGVTWLGVDKKEVFAPVPPEDYLDSIREDIANAQRDILQNPVYVVLNLCRVLAYVQEGLVLSKQQGAVWGMEHLPGVYRGVIAAALRRYEGGPAAGELTDAGALASFARDMLGRLFVPQA